MSKQLQQRFRILGFLIVMFFIKQEGHAQAIHLDLRSSNLAKVVAALQAQAPGVNFSYSQEVLEKVQTGELQLNTTRLKEALEVLQTRYGLHYLMDGKNVTLKYLPLSELPATEYKKIEGIVTDDKGQPVIGATISVKGTGRGKITDVNGHYSIEAQAGKQLEVSSIGFGTQVVTVHDQAVINIRLANGVNELHEMVFVGYQKMRKSDFTGVVASVKAKELNISAPSLGQALVGKVAGVVVSQTDGSPYASPKIRVRGVGSINAGSDPLYVIDGYPAGNDLYINPNDIESIDILKDAASAAIYGSRASGGVVLITTKRGKEGNGKLDYDFQYGIGQLAKKVKLLNAQEFAQLVVDGRNDSYKDLVQNAGLVWNDVMYSDDNPTRIARVGNAASISIPTELYDFPAQKVRTPKYNTDWQDAVYRNAPFMRHNLAFSGGSKTTRYAVSGDYQRQDGIMRNTGQQRVNFRANLDADVSDKLKIGTNISYTSNTNQETQEGRWDHSPAMGALIYMPIFPVYNDDGSLATNLAAAQSAAYGYQTVENPVATLERIKITRKGNRSTYNGFATYELISHLVFKANLGLQTYNEKYDSYQPSSLSVGSFAPYSPQAIAAANAYAQTVSQKDRLAEFTLNYNRDFGKHSLNALAGYTAQETNSDVISVSALGFQNDLIPEITAGTAGQVSVGGGKSTNTLLSYLGRVQYSYDGKYYLTGSLRMDGSSRFGSNNRWAKFPSLSAGWNVSKESFYQGWLADHSTLRLRASWGLSGNNSIGNYNALQTMVGPSSVIFGNNIVSNAYYVGGIADPNLGWESTSQYNVGIDVGLFHDRLLLIANYYDSRTFNLLFRNNISAVSGSTTILTNLRDSKIQNKGFDFQIDGKVVKSENFNLNLNANISINRNKVLNLGGASTIMTAGAERSYLTHITKTGEPVGMFYGYQVAGMVRESDMANIAIDNANYDPKTQSFPKGYMLKGPARSLAQTNRLRPGDLYFKDVNGDGVVNASDLGIIGSPYPKFTYGFSLSANYRQIDLAASFAGSYGNQVLDGQDYYLYNMEGSGNNYQDVVNRYRSEDQPGDGHVFRASRAGTQSNSTRLSTFYLQDGSFFRCTNLSIGYKLPVINGLRKTGISAIRVYGSINNAFTITKYKGYNPEVDFNYSTGNSTANLTPGVDYGIYPLVRSYNMGIHMTY